MKFQRFRKWLDLMPPILIDYDKILAAFMEARNLPAFAFNADTDVLHISLRTSNDLIPRFLARDLKICNGSLRQITLRLFYLTRSVKSRRGELQCELQLRRMNHLL